MLALLHGGACALHFVLFLVVVVWFSVNDTWDAGNVKLSRPSAKNYEDGDMAFYEPGVETSGTFPGVPLLAVICGVTFVAHAFYAYSSKGGVSSSMMGQWMKQKYNPARYLEYGVSASLMILIIASLSGVRDFGALGMMFVATAVTMLFGYLAEKTFARKTGSPWLAFGGGAALTLSVWCAIAYAFFSTTSEVDETPDWLPAIFWTQLICFTLFPVVSALYATNKLSFERAEASYVGLSFTSKLVLAVILLFAFVSPSEDGSTDATAQAGTMS